MTRKKALAWLLCISATHSGCTLRLPMPTAEASPDILLSTDGAILAEGPTLRVRGESVRYAEHRITLRLGEPVRVTLTSPDEGFDPILECRPVDGLPDETLRNDDAQGLGNGSQLDLLPSRDSDWCIYVGDSRGNPGMYRLEARRIHEREVFVASGAAPSGATGMEARPAYFCPIRMGRRYRVTVEADGFPPHLSLFVPGMPPTASNSASMEFCAVRTGQAILEVASLSLANGTFRLRVAEIW